MKILIAEDDFTSRTILEGILKKWGYEPVVTHDGQAAWDALQDPDAPRLVVLDWNMPGLDGLEVCRRIRQLSDANQTYIIILTARGEKSDIVAGLNAGANDYISKPYDTEELRARIGVGRRMVELQSELKRARDALEYEAMHDPLTGIYNRRTTTGLLAKELARSGRGNGKVAIGLCDIDFFKKVNDSYGHQVGDEVLCGFVQALHSSLREYDHIGRYGGEEFLVVASGSNSWNEMALFERLCETISRTEIPTSAGPVSISISIGVATACATDNVDSIIARADAALYRAKRAGRKRAMFNESDAPDPAKDEGFRFQPIGVI